METEKIETGFWAVCCLMLEESTDADREDLELFEARITHAWLRLSRPIQQLPAFDVARCIRLIITEEQRAEIAEAKLRGIHPLAYLVDDAMIWFVPRWEALRAWWWGAEVSTGGDL